MSQARNQKNFTMSEVAVDREELMITAVHYEAHCTNERLDSVQHTDIPLLQSAILDHHL